MNNVQKDCIAPRCSHEKLFGSDDAGRAGPPPDRCDSLDETRPGPSAFKDRREATGPRPSEPGRMQDLQAVADGLRASPDTQRSWACAAGLSLTVLACGYTLVHNGAIAPGLPAVAGALLGAQLGLYRGCGNDEPLLAALTTSAVVRWSGVFREMMFSKDFAADVAPSLVINRFAELALRQTGRVLVDWLTSVAVYEGTRVLFGRGKPHGPGAVS